MDELTKELQLGVTHRMSAHRHPSDGKADSLCEKGNRDNLASRDSPSAKATMSPPHGVAFGKQVCVPVKSPGIALKVNLGGQLITEAYVVVVDTHLRGRQGAVPP